MVIAEGLARVPVAERHLRGENGEGHRHHGERRHDARGDLEMLALEEPVRERECEHSVEDRSDAAAPSAERIPAERHEQRHRADRDHAA